MSKKRKVKKKHESTYTIVMFLIAIVLFFILKIDPAAVKDFIKSQVPEQESLYLNGEMQVHFLDVGQGDCSLIRLPLDEKAEYKNILIDSGERGNGERIIDYLEGLGVDTLDAVIVTHPHSDHMGCMDEIIRRFNVKSFYMGYFPEELTPITASYEDMLDALKEKNLKINLLKKGDKLSNITKGVAAADIEVLAPSVENTPTDLNNSSLIFKLTFSGASFLFTGDAETEEYNGIMGKIGKVEVLKVGHHGASNANGKELLYELMPKYAVISCGKNNDYGHPHTSVLDTFKKIGTEVLRTDLKGTIVIKTDGVKIITE